MRATSRSLLPALKSKVRTPAGRAGTGRMDVTEAFESTGRAATGPVSASATGETVGVGSGPRNLELFAGVVRLVMVPKQESPQTIAQIVRRVRGVRYFRAMENRP